MAALYACQINADASDKEIQPGWRPFVPRRTSMPPAKQAIAIEQMSSCTLSGAPTPTLKTARAKTRPNMLVKCQLAQRIRMFLSFNGGALMLGTTRPSLSFRKIMISPRIECATAVSSSMKLAVISRYCIWALLWCATADEITMTIVLIGAPWADSMSARVIQNPLQMPDIRLHGLPYSQNYRSVSLFFGGVHIGLLAI